MRKRESEGQIATKARIGSPTTMLGVNRTYQDRVGNLGMRIFGFFTFRFLLAQCAGGRILLLPLLDVGSVSPRGTLGDVRVSTKSHEAGAKRRGATDR